MKTHGRSAVTGTIIFATAVALVVVGSQMLSSTAKAATSALSLSSDEASFNSSTAKKAASSGTKTKGNNGVGNGLDPQPPGNPRINDGPGTGPGNPGNKPPKP